MKTTRFFIVLGACALVFTIALGSIESCVHPSWAQTPVRRADPWAGDPDMPGVGYQMPFDEGFSYSRIQIPCETTASAATAIRSPEPRSLWELVRARAFLTALFRKGW
jgi:hypothetical protein